MKVIIFTLVTFGLGVATIAYAQSTDASPVPVGELGTPAGLIAAALILRGHVPTVRILYRRDG